jgi:hypothetical protein
MSGSRVERGGSGAREALDAEAAPSGFWGWYGSADCRPPHAAGTPKRWDELWTIKLVNQECS